MLQSEVCNRVPDSSGGFEASVGPAFERRRRRQGATVGRAQTYYRNPNTPQPHRSKVHATGQVGRAAV